MTSSTLPRPPRTVVVTGASAGIGRAVARAFARDGDDVALLARGRDGLEAAAEEVRAEGRRALVVQVDVSDPDALDAAAGRVEEELGPIDVWVNNAMVSVFSPFVEMTPEEFRRVVEVTMLGSVYGTHAALKRMHPRDRGHVIQVGSALAFRGIPLQSAYCGAKAGINGMLDSVRAELKHDRSRVRISSAHLPAVNTPQFDVVRNKLGHHGQPVPPIYQPEVAADAVLWLSHHPHRREMWVGASTAPVIIGSRIAPGLLDRYLGRTNYKAQQTGEPWSADMPDYVFAPLPGDRGAHGAFDDQAIGRDPVSALSRHRRTAIGVSAAAAAALAGLLAGRSR